MFNIKAYNRSYLDMWNARMCRPNVEPLVDKVVVAVLKKQGFNDFEYIPRNIYKPEALYETLENFDPEHSHFVDFKDDRVKAGLGMAYRAFAKPKHEPKLEAISLDGRAADVYHLLEIKGDKSAGLTAYGQTKAEAFPTAMRKLQELLTNRRAPDPCLAGTRTQAGKEGRLVWGYPMMMTLLEGCIARPLLNRFKGSDLTPMAFGKSSSHMGIEMRKAISHNRYYVSMDASKFDSTIQAGVIQAGFNALRTWFDLEQQIGWGRTVGEVFDIIENYFIHTPIVMPSDRGPLLYRGKRHGVPSGSYFTQIIDSFANVMLIGTLDKVFKLHLRLEEINVLGDDMLFFTNKKPNLDAYASILSKLYSMRVNAKKSVWGLSTDPVHFLGRNWKNGLPTRSFKEVATRAVSPERYRDYGDDKWKGASGVIASYGFTSMIEDVPPRFEPFQSIVARRVVKNGASGLTQFLMGEGLISNRVQVKLF